MIMKTKLKERVNELECNMGGDFHDKAEEIFEQLIIKACNRAHANGRKTVSAKDL